jgi:hypothetical protein
MTTYTNSQEITIANRMIQRINEAKNHNLLLADMFEYVEQDFNFNNPAIDSLFNKVFHANFKFEDFTKC